MVPKVAFYMLAYNTKETYLRKAVESVLNQTEKSLIFFIQDNGSTDKTKDILREYADKDSRIILFRNEINCAVTEQEHEERQKLFEKYFVEAGTEYFAVIDSDDYYKLGFLEVMYAEAKRTDADIIMCGTTHINEEETQVIMKRLPPDFCLPGEKLSDEGFIQLYATVRTLWGKLYSRRLWETYWYLLDRERPTKLTNGIDTYVMLSLLSKVKNVVSINKSLHYFRIRNKSLYHSSLNINRINEGEILFTKGMEYSKVLGICNEKVVTFLCNVYHNHIIDLLNILCLSKEMEIDTKVEYIRKILEEPLYKMICEKNSQFIHCIFDTLSILALKSTSEQRRKMIHAINYKRTLIHETIKAEMIGLLDQGENELASVKANKLLIELPLEEDILYFNIFINILLENRENVQCLSKTAMNFYPYSKDIQELLCHVPKL